MKIKILTLTLLMTFFSLLKTSAQGKIGEIENELQENEKHTDTYNENDSEDSTLGDQLIDDAGNALFAGCGNILAALVIETTMEKEWDEEYDDYRSVQDYPFKNGFDGRYTRDLETRRPVAFDLGINIFDDGNNISGGVLEGRFFINRYISLDGKYQFLNEKIITSVDTIKQNLNLSNLNLSYHRLSFTHVDFWFGIGVNTLAIKQNQYLGLNFNIGTEIFIPPIFSVGTSWKFGQIKGLDVRDGNAFLKLHLKRFIIDAGYQKYQIGSTTIEGIKTGIGWHF